MDKFIHIRSTKFPILPGEKEELVNEGMYGKALAQYLQGKLKDRGYDAPFICCEDYGFVFSKIFPRICRMSSLCCCDAMPKAWMISRINAAFSPLKS